jgi:hypothetical protein
VRLCEGGAYLALRRPLGGGAAVALRLFNHHCLHALSVESR